MQEDFLHYVWKMKLFSMSVLETTEGESILIYSTGDHSEHSGPDFTNAKIKIGDTVWAGNVEIHINSSDWQAHQHDNDRAYDNVILHVVFNHDKMVGDFPTLELKNIIPEELIHKYAFMMQTAAWIPCEKSINQVTEIIIRGWLSRLLTERIESKALKFEQRLMLNKNNWEETCYQLIARNFGSHVNADPFERVTRSLPFNLIRKHINQPMQVEALLFGQAGFLEANFRELYPHQLQAEYKFLQKKYALEPIRTLEWKFLRMRPANFPTIRMSQFANFISQHDILFSKILESNHLNEIRKLFNASAGAYWKEHYHFKKSAPVKSTHIGKSTIDLIIMNTIAPLMYLYGKQTGEMQYVQKSINLIEQLPPEKNNILDSWQKLNVKALHAGESQALMELKENYCNLKRCLDCNIGHQVLKKVI